MVAGNMDLPKKRKLSVSGILYRGEKRVLSTTGESLSSPMSSLPSSPRADAPAPIVSSSEAVTRADCLGPVQIQLNTYTCRRRLLSSGSDRSSLVAWDISGSEPVDA